MNSCHVHLSKCTNSIERLTSLNCITINRCFDAMMIAETIYTCVPYLYSFILFLIPFYFKHVFIIL